MNTMSRASIKGRRRTYTQGGQYHTIVDQSEKYHTITKFVIHFLIEDNGRKRQHRST